MPGKKRPAVDEGDSSEDEINVDLVIKTKAELDKIRKDREKKRAQIQADLEKKLNDLRTCIKQSANAHTKQLGDVHKQQVDELLQAMEARDNMLVAIGKKLSEMQEKGSNLATHLGQAYEYRMKRLEGLTMPVAEQRHDKNRNKVDGA